MNGATLTVLRRVAPIVAAVAIFVVVLQIAGFAGGDVVGAIVKGSVGTPNALLQSLRWSIPLIIMGLGAVVSFRAGFFNVGGLGQFYLGAIGATAVAVGIPAAVPSWVAIPCAIAAGALMGMIWSLIPGILRVFFGADEVVTTIMANFIAQYLLLYLVSGPLMDRSSATAQGAASPPIPEAFRISTSNGISPVTIGILVVVIAGVAFLILRTSFGVLSGIAGRNSAMLQWQGVKVRRIGLQAFALSGALAGLAGAMEILGPTGKLMQGISPQVGNNAMLVALVAGLSVAGTVFAAWFFAMLTAASLFLPIAVSLPASAIVVLNGIIAILVTAQVKLPRRWRRRRVAAAVPAQAEGER
ncbi:ABC transporter permease [Microbacterium sp. SORGH_AS_0888]|uniref:ABC transporter permease n=1 Tax=Microbacterium sp. SORGH_AS_0888 TaxID=3041791 RepID=UPI0027848DC7|nr:ABC transporter permease [Microbacterium sp. SORGH_AS_0888]MDQ1130319.1 ABC-type uncharacterized transport system permease subunit [Microbacterium sp. SORGH_AS_0888]